MSLKIRVGALVWLPFLKAAQPQGRNVHDPGLAFQDQFRHCLTDDRGFLEAVANKAHRAVETFHTRCWSHQRVPVACVYIDAGVTFAHAAIRHGRHTRTEAIQNPIARDRRESGAVGVELVYADG